MKIAIIGPTNGRESLLSSLTRYANSICAQTEISAAEKLSELPQDSWQLAFIYVHEGCYDTYLAFLSAYPDCEVVLCAEDDHLACSAMRNHPCGFLIFPTDDESFLRVMKKCRSWIDALRVIGCSDANSARKLRCIEIRYVKSAGHSCSLFCREDTYTINRGLSAVQQQLGDGFLLCHRGIVVNIRYIADIRNKTVLLQDGTELPLSPALADTVQTEVAAYFREHGCFIQGGGFL